VTGTEVAGVVPPDPAGRLHAEAQTSTSRVTIDKILFSFIGTPSLDDRLYVLTINNTNND
jgi:hypothetical protein